MEKQRQELSEITAAYKARLEDLQNLTDQVNLLGGQIAEISNKIEKSDQNPGVPVKHAMFNEVSGKLPNIIPFPKKFQAFNIRNESSSFLSEAKPDSSIITAAPGNQLPAGTKDFRSALQRDGLILLSWDYRKTGKGNRLTAYWVTSTGIPRFYASKLLTAEEFSSARPHHKSYAAEDGIEFYGQDAPVYMVHVAPELMKSNPRHRELRQAHIEMLLHHGIKSDFNFKYLLKNEKNRNSLQKKDNKRAADSVGA
jgi:hypothetical protein